MVIPTSSYLLLEFTLNEVLSREENAVKYSIQTANKGERNFLIRKEEKKYIHVRTSISIIFSPLLSMNLVS